MADEENHDQIIADFAELTGTSAGNAQRYLSANQWDLAGAAAEFYASQEEGTTGASEAADEPSAEPEAPYDGPRTLDGRPAPQSAPAAAAPSSRRTGVAGIATLGSISQNQDPHAGHGHSHDDDDDDSDEDINMADDDDDEEPRDLFAGGEKSGLAVQDPNNKKKNDPRKVVNDILKKARENAASRGGGGGGPSSAAAPPSRFRGTGNTVGGDDAPSQSIPDPSARPAAPPAGEVQTRILHLWEDGFSVEDGPLRRFDDAQNAQDLSMIRSGRAPLHLMGVAPGQPVDVQLVKHEEAYKTPPKVYKPFSGTGNRLGSPTPGGSDTITAPAPSASTPASTSPAAPQIDSSVPAVTLRLQLANGTRLPARFNTTQTIGDVYDFINLAGNNNGRAWVLATTFPNKDHTDKSLVLGEMAEFKRGGVAVQKWT